MTVEVPEGLHYTDSHEWLRVEGSEGTIGISAYAAGEMGDVVYVDLPAVGRHLEKAASLGVIESVRPRVTSMRLPPAR